MSNSKHPEARDGEVFLGNETGATLQKSRWKTARMGNRAYDKRGRLITGSSLHPMFAQKSELDAAGVEVSTGTYWPTTTSP